MLKFNALKQSSLDEEQVKAGGGRDGERERRREGETERGRDGERERRRGRERGREGERERGRERNRDRRGVWCVVIRLD
jgi:hypothetical protein